MTVYVDNLTSVPANIPNWHWPTACHLYADPVEELHSFAVKIGMQRRWFQDHPTLPHYDLNAGRRRAAVRNGAVETTRGHLVAMIRRRRSELKE